MSDRALATLGRAQAALAECKTAMEAKQIADHAEAARVYLERTNASVETVNRATEIRTLAERQMGEFLSIAPKNRGANGSRFTGAGREPVKDDTPTLAEIGITKKQSARAQKLAAIPAQEFHERIAVAKASGGKLSLAKVLCPASAIKSKTTAKVFEFAADGSEPAKPVEFSKQVFKAMELWNRMTAAERKEFTLWIQSVEPRGGAIHPSWIVIGDKRPVRAPFYGINQQ